MVEQGVIEEASRRVGGGAFGDRRKGARPRAVRHAAGRRGLWRTVTQSTKRLARYQRKWLRRLTGVVTLDGDRPAEEIADEIVALERPGERLSRH